VSFQLNEIVPWGRSLREYELMFSLAPEDRGLRILGCGDGPASFNAEMTTRGHSVISFDPIYQFTGAQIQSRFLENADRIVEQVRANPGDYVWTFHRDIDELRRNREEALRIFLSDFGRGIAEKRYISAELPTLPFANGSFDLALSSHLLFLYSELLSFDFHLASICEILRVSKELRIFPMLALDCKPSPHLPGLIKHLRQLGLEVSIETVNYELQRGGNEMMRIRRRAA